MQACDRCHRRKTKCDKIRPECGPCAKGGSQCFYSDKSKEPLYRKEVVERLERKNRQLEATNRHLTARLDSIRSGEQQIRSAAQSNTQPYTQSHNDTRRHNDIANEVSFFSTSAGGDRQFLGSASGLLFANIVNASLITSVTRDPPGTLSSSPQGTGPSVHSQGKPEWSIDDSNLPPFALARRLVDAYLAHDHLCYPCLHPNSVRMILDSVYNDQSYYRDHVVEAFTFDMLLAIGTLQVHKFNWQALPDAETHHMRAMLRLNTVLSGGGLQALQAMLLLCQFRLSSSTKDTSGSLWHLVGVAARMSLELGLHRESVYELKDSGQVSQENNSSNGDFEHQEVRRRCFWCVFTLDRIVSITLGRPLAICLEDVDVELPQIDIGEAISPAGTTTSDGRDSVYSTANSRTALFVHIVRYRALCGKFLTSLHRSSRSVAQPENQLRKIREELTLELESWRADTGTLNLSEVDLSSPIAEALSSFRSKAWYELLYHNAMLLLYRPTPSLPPSDASGDISRIFNSAKQSITLYSYLFRSRKINFSWMVLHAVFMAGLSYVYAVSRHIRHKRKKSPSPGILLSENPTIVEIVNNCRACSQILVAVSERCNAQKNCHEVFDRLSDAVLADAVEVTSAATLQSNVGTGVARAQPQQTSGSSNFAAESSAFATSNHASHEIVPIAGAIDSDGLRRGEQVIAPQPQASYSGYLNPGHIVPPLAADSAIQDCFPDLQQIYDAQWGDDAILHLSMDWIGDIDPNVRFT